ncbi:hypothetical protein [Winogradskyella poriferorum]|uniref:hypothetical protein n=1 Tax=Winogradskyella poriferorum TaxID=307627 RepID=UPI003D647513
MKKVRQLMLLVLCALLLNTTCDDDTIPQESECDAFAIIDDFAFDNNESSFFEIISANIEGDCLNIEISASGCSGETWQIELFSNTVINESLPVQRGLKLILTNNEACLAVFTRQTSFDLTTLQVEGENEINFNLEGFEESVNYSY